MNHDGSNIESRLWAAADELLRPIHDRMPGIVPKDKEALWIDPGLHDQQELEAILKPYPAGEMKMAEGFLPLPTP